MASWSAEALQDLKGSLVETILGTMNTISVSELKANTNSP